MAPGVSTEFAGTTTSMGWPLSKVPALYGVCAWAALVMVLPDAPGPVPAAAVPTSTNASDPTAQMIAEESTAKACEVRRVNMRGDSLGWSEGVAVTIKASGKHPQWPWINDVP